MGRRWLPWAPSRRAGAGALAASVVGKGIAPWDPSLVSLLTLQGCMLRALSSWG